MHLLSFHQSLSLKIFRTHPYQKRIALIGRNGSGKSTLIKALLGNKHIYKTGNWYVVKREYIGYLDQNYNTLSSNKRYSK